MTTPRPRRGHPGTRRRRRPLAVLLAVSATLAAAACGDDTDSSGSDVAGRPDLTEPGATLRVGDTATVTRGGPRQVLKVTIDDVRTGKARDLPPVDLSEPVGRVYYVDYELEHVSGDSPYLPVDDFLSGWAGDELLSMVVLLEPSAPCQEKTFPDQAPEGTVVEGCAVFVTARGGAPLDRLELSYGDDYDAADDHQVSWAAS